jgi:hypothetical protein
MTLNIYIYINIIYIYYIYYIYIYIMNIRDGTILLMAPLHVNQLEASRAERDRPVVGRHPPPVKECGMGWKH